MMKPDDDFAGDHFGEHVEPPIATVPCAFHIGPPGSPCQRKVPYCGASWQQHYGVSPNNRIIATAPGRAAVQGGRRR
jgi:hypothetical protein